MKEKDHALLGLIKKTDMAFNFLSKVCAVISGIILIGVTLMISAGVLNRALTNWVWLFVEEWGGLALVPMSYLVFGYTLRQDQHLKMDLIVRRLSEKWKNVFAIFAAVFSLVCLVFMIQSSSDWFLYTFKRNVSSSGPMKTPLWMFSASILVSLVLFAIDMLLFLINRLLLFKYKVSQLRFHDQSSADSPFIED